MEAYYKVEELSEPQDWLLIGEISPNHKPFHIKSWKDIALDLSLTYPKYFDIRKEEKGVMDLTKGKSNRNYKSGDNNHCIIEFSSIVEVDSLLNKI
mmetsp:Transcript_803/g.755  ORF Transcript_803/g.755 Transcript_803/m.755 type:complete len:96 (+) Transcript_803:643-930(+)